MATWFGNEADGTLDSQLKFIRDNAERVVLLNTYSAADTYATVIAGSNILCSVAIAAGDFDAIAGAAANARRLTLQAQSGTASNTSSTPDLHVAILDDSASLILAVTDETSDQAITSGNTVNFQAWYIEARQPVAV